MHGKERNPFSTSSMNFSFKANCNKNNNNLATISLAVCEKCLFSLVKHCKPYQISGTNWGKLALKFSNDFSINGSSCIKNGWLFNELIFKKLENLRRFPLNVRAVSAKIKLPKKYLQHCHILRTDKNLSLLLLPS